MRKFKSYTLEEFTAWIRRFQATRPINHIQIHHTWRHRKTDYKGERTIWGMWNYHVNTNGWRDIGQHFSIAPDGTIWDGRDLNQIPAGISGHNTGGICIEMIGDFDRGQETLEGEQLHAVLGTVNALLQRFSLTTKSIVFHREHSAKTCPGTGIDKTWFINQVTGWKEKPIAPAPAPVYTATPFPDVPDHYHGVYAINDMKKAGIINGHSDGTFGFGTQITKETLAVVLHRFAEVYQLKPQK
ncbi:N-acetylmuramoyl-L-alanine amidase [Bacillus sp. FJAT-45350]|uniref:N-acetylmuramoyl-L-alanine amidase n=1 Tax=Bacillus sp. FJAT-45350 TaxID=2011014 RepID=UPI000BB8FB46|nr:N-acetylmuramoyl-L-alanine amidase [Bacillus sp. FJAT-45350]